MRQRRRTQRSGRLSSRKCKAMKRILILCIALIALAILATPARADPAQIHPMYIVYLPMVVERPCAAEEMFVTCHMEAGNR